MAISMADVKLDNIIEKFSVLSDKPAKFLSVQADLKDDIKNLVKSLYDFTKEQEKSLKREKKGALPELIVQDFDDEQIWQQIELQNEEVKDQLVWEVANCISKQNDLMFPIKIGEQQPANKTKNITDDLPSDTDITSQKPRKKKDTKQSKNKSEKSKPKVKSSIVDDKFFKLQEMEQFLLQQERNEGKNVPEHSDDESIDYFEDLDSEDDEEEGEGARDVKYYDFFDQIDDGGDQKNNEDSESDQGELDDDDDQEIDGEETANGQVLDDEMDSDEELDDDENMPENDGNEVTKQPQKKDKKVTFADVSSSDDDSESDVNDIVTDKTKVSNEKKSEFEMRQERLKKQIEKLEENTLNEAPWQLKGEVDAMKRPQNSLLEEVVDFDLTSRPAPIITEQTTLTLEDIIRQRIKDKAWDDVEKKEKPVDDQLNFRKTEILDHSKSKLSLAQVYEAEYLKQKKAASGDVEEEKEPEAHTQIRDAMTQLFAKLDALCHYHYTPKAPQAEVKIVSNTPAISMEEVAPVATSDATLLAPEEVKKKQRGDLMTKEERTQTDKNRERRKKKKFQRAKGGHVTKVTDHRNTKKGVEANDKSLKTSKAFFTQLNEDATSLIKKNKIAKLGKVKGK